MQDQLSLIPIPSELRLSVSKTKCFDQCAKQFHFTYVLKLPRKDHDFFIFGQFVHRIMELFYEFKIAKDERSNSILMGDAFKSSLKEFSQRLTDEQKKEAYSIVDSYLQKLAKEGESDYDVLSVEKKFAVNINDTVVLNGMIDRIDIDKDGVISVLDYKSTKNKKYLKDEFFQLLTYAYVLWTEDPTITRVRGAYILLRHNFERIEKEFSLAEIMEVKNKYEDYAKRIESEQLFQANPTRMCTYCDHLALCAEGKEFTNPLIKSGDNKWV